MHSSRMRTVRSGSHLPGGGRVSFVGGLLTGGCLLRGCLLWEGAVPMGCLFGGGGCYSSMH